MDAYMEDKENRGEDVDSWLVSNKQTMTTCVAVGAWEAFRHDKEELVKPYGTRMAQHVLLKRATRCNVHSIVHL